MELLFNAPWWLYGIPIIVGLIMLYVGLRKGDKSLRNVGAIVAVAGLAVFIASKSVETDQEKVTRQARELVASVEQRDWPALTALLDPGAVLTLLNAGQIYGSRDEIVTACQSRVDGSKVSSLVVTRVDPQQEGDLLTTEIEVYVAADDSGGRRFPTTWRLVWTQRNGKDWVVRDIEAIKFPMPDVRTWFPGGSR